MDTNRKLIEQKMEKFKICEKETKTKKFSKEGLAQDRTDPRQKAKWEVGEWVREFISRLQVQIEEFEAEIESLENGKKKKKECIERIAEFNQSIERHQHHVEMLERVLRAVDNDAVTPEEANDLRDGIEYYVDSNQDADFYEDEGMYDELNLDEIAAPVPVIGKLKGSKGDERGETGGSSSTSLPLSSSPLAASAFPKSQTPSPQKSTRGTSPIARIRSSNLANPVSPPPATRTVQPFPRSTLPGSSATNAPLMSSIVKGSTQLGNGRPAGAVGTLMRDNIGKDLAGAVNTSGTRPNGSSVNYAAHVRKGISSAPKASPPARVLPKSSPFSAATAMPQAVPEEIEKLLNSSSPAAPIRYVEPTIEEVEAQLGMLDSGYTNMPEAAELQRRPGIAPRNLVATPPCFPSTPAPIFDNPAIFEKFDPDTLFFIFYYQQGTQQQYLAARELKKESWRFHKKYLTWFQRHEEPKVSTDDYEQGTYVYFDYVLKDEREFGWCQRIKSEFTFEYKYLEDELKVD